MKLLKKCKAKYAVFILIPLLLVLAVTGCSKKYQEDKQIKIDSKLGYDSKVSIYGGNPVEFNIKNSGGDFSGKLKIVLPGGYQQKTEIIIPVEIPASSEKIIKEYIPLNIIVKTLSYYLEKDGVIVKQGKLKCDKFLSPEKAKLAVVAEDKDAYSFFASAYLGAKIDHEYREKYNHRGGAEAAVAEPLEEDLKKGIASAVYFENLKDFSNERFGEYFDYIFIGDISDLKLSEEGVKNLENWVKNGGKLIVETGKNFEKMNKLIPDSLRQVDFTSALEMVYDIGEGETPFMGPVDVALGELRRDEIKPIAIDNQILCYVENYGAGKIMTINTLLNGKAAKNWNIKSIYFNFLLEISEFSEYSNNNSFSEFISTEPYVCRQLIDMIPGNENMPKVLIFGVFALYIILVGPVLYIVLKKLDKRTMIWIIAPLISILLVFTVRIIGQNYWGNKPISNEISVIYNEDGSDVLNVKTRLGLFNNRRKTIEITSEKASNLKFINRNERYYYDDNYVYDEKTAELVSSLELTNPAKYSDYDTNLWQKVIALNYKNIPIKKEESYIKFEFDGDDQKIKFKSGIPIEFSNPIIYMNGMFYKLEGIGKVEQGKEYTYDLKKAKKSQNVYQIMMNYGDLRTAEKELANREIFMREMIESINLTNSNSLKIFMVGYNQDEIGYGVKINERDPKVYSRNLVVLDMPLKMESGKKVQLSEDFLDIRTYGIYDSKGSIDERLNNAEFRELTVDNFDPFGNELRFMFVSGTDLISSEIFIPEKMSVESLKIDFNHNYKGTLESLNKYDEDKLKDSFYILNVQSGKYDEINIDVDDYTAEKIFEVDLEKYLDKTYNRVSIAIQKPEYFNNEDNYSVGEYVICPHKVKVEGVFND